MLSKKEEKVKSEKASLKRKDIFLSIKNLICNDARDLLNNKNRKNSDFVIFCIDISNMERDKIDKMLEYFPLSTGDIEEVLEFMKEVYDREFSHFIQGYTDLTNLNRYMKDNNLYVMGFPENMRQTQVICFVLDEQGQSMFVEDIAMRLN